MDAPPAQTFATQRAAMRALGNQQFAMEVPQISRVASAADTKHKRLKAEQWQVEAYNHANEIGELGYVLTLMASTLAKGQLVVVEEDEDGNIVEPQRDEDGNEVYGADRLKAERVLRALRGPTGDHKSLLYATAHHDQIAGEALLLGEPIEDTNGISWEILSVLEVVEDANTRKKTRKRSAAATRTLNFAGDSDINTEINEEEGAYLTRYHRPDLAHSGDPTSALRRNAGVCREIVLLDQLKETMIMSRLANNVILAPEEVSFPADDDGIEDMDDADRLLEMLIRHMSAPVEDRRSTASLVPLVIRCPAEMIEKWKLFGLTDGNLDLSVVQEARDDALKRLAGGIDLPLERMQGMGSTSHWNASAIDVDEVRKHITPLGERIAQFFTVRYQRRMMIEWEEVDEKIAERFSLAFDGSAILARMDEAASAESLWDKILISDDALIEANGLDPDAVRPSNEERNRRLLERITLSPSANNRTLLPGVINFDQFEDLDEETLEAFLAPSQAGAPVEEETDESEDDPENEDPAPQPPGGPVQPAVGEPTPEDELAIIERLRATASFSLDAAIKYSANQVCSNARKLSEETRARVDQPALMTGPRKPEVIRMLSAADWKAIDRTPEKLLARAWDEFNQQAIMWLSDLYERRGLNKHSADEHARRAASEICHQLDAIALGAFRKPVARGRDGLAVPLDLVLSSVDGVGVGR